MDTPVFVKHLASSANCGCVKYFREFKMKKEPQFTTWERKKWPLQIQRQQQPGQRHLLLAKSRLTALACCYNHRKLSHYNYRWKLGTNRMLRSKKNDYFTLFEDRRWEAVPESFIGYYNIRLSTVR